MNILLEIIEWSKVYELNFQFWPDQCSVYINKDFVELTSIGGCMEPLEVMKKRVNIFAGSTLNKLN